MVRVIGFFIGLGFVGVAAWSLLWGAIAFVQDPPERTVEARFHLHPKHVSLPSDGPLGHYDRAQLQRGLQVYEEVCAACHGLNLVAFRNLAELGYHEAEIKAIANRWRIEVPDINPESGEATTRKPTLVDRFPNPYANDVAARAANNNALPPDLSLITKARHGGADYIYSLLTGYRNPPANLPPGARPGPGLYYNPYFANLNIAMPPPITADGQVTYEDGTNATVNQMAKDVSAFLVWTAEPRLENRHRAGLATLIFLIIATALGYVAYRNIWVEAKGRKVRVTGPLDPKNVAKREAASREAGIEG
jgi:ubiquinol-cytochrome c reductase cytochrome c1 subunit